MIEERPALDQHVIQTVKMFRDVGYTINAMRHPLSDAAVAWLCQFNGAPEGWKSPSAWRYAPNPACQAMLEKKAAATGAKPDGIPLTCTSLTASKVQRPVEDKREPRNSPAAPIQLQ